MGADGDHRSIEIDEDEHFQRRQLRAARLAVAAFLVVIVLGLLGLFGSGPVSHATAREAGGAFAVNYQRFLRFTEETDVEVRLRRAEGAAEVSFDRNFLEGFQFDGVLPEPDSQTTEEGRLVFRFEEEAPAIVRVSLTPRKIGLQRASVRVGRSRPVSFRQFVYP